MVRLFDTSFSNTKRREEQQFGNKCVWLYNITISQKIEKVNIFSYNISEQPKETQRINFLLISEDVETDSKDTAYNDEEIIDENNDPDVDYST